MNESQSREVSEIIRMKKVQGRSRVQIAQRLITLADRIAVETQSDGRTLYTLREAVYHFGTWSEEELSNMQKAMNQTQSDTPLDIVNTGLLSRNAEQICDKLVALRKARKLVQEERVGGGWAFRILRAPA
eukprot:GHVT01014289.1.p1 GENE.GHVT01014289.1~~GHVT01014289.1.p1  ORF type:complete len:130 (+),score=7.55 GHVT01014289.1:372-761(+)